MAGVFYPVVLANAVGLAIIGVFVAKDKKSDDIDEGIEDGKNTTREEKEEEDAADDAEEKEEEARIEEIKRSALRKEEEEEEREREKEKEKESKDDLDVVVPENTDLSESDKENMQQDVDNIAKAAPKEGRPKDRPRKDD